MIVSYDRKTFIVQATDIDKCIAMSCLVEYKHHKLLSGMTTAIPDISSELPV